MNPRQWYEQTIGKSYDTDGAYGAQCWDYFDYFCRRIGFTGSRKCASTGYAGDLWLLRDTSGYNYSTAFDYIYNPGDFKDGDWIFWDKHVAMYYLGMELGQNQYNKPYVTAIQLNKNGILGAMRWRGWGTSTVPYGYTETVINDHSYHIRRMTGTDKITVLSAGLNKVMPISKIDADVLISARIAGANYFQMRSDTSDPINTTYGDISAPFNGVYQSLPNQHTTLFYDLDTGLFGDCTGVEINSSHSVFSPALVFPNSKGHWEYAEMVGLSHKDLKSWYTFLVRFPDGYAIGIADQEMTPQEIADDFIDTDMVNIAFLDGGGSAQAGFWHDSAMDYVRDTGREIPSVLAIYREIENTIPVEVPQEPETPETPEQDAVTPEPEKPETEDEQMETKPIENWKDPEKIDTTLKPLDVFLFNLANLFKVKSILTFSLVFAYIALLFSGIEIPKFLETLLTMVVGCFFGYQFNKNGGGDGKNG